VLQFYCSNLLIPFLLSSVLHSTLLCSFLSLLYTWKFYIVVALDQDFYALLFLFCIFIFIVIFD
jgi:hypothetical protein